MAYAEAQVDGTAAAEEVELELDPLEPESPTQLQLMVYLPLVFPFVSVENAEALKSRSDNAHPVHLSTTVTVTGEPPETVSSGAEGMAPLPVIWAVIVLPQTGLEFVLPATAPG